MMGVVVHIGDTALIVGLVLIVAVCIAVAAAWDARHRP